MRTTASRFGVDQYANSGNHLHIVLKGKTKKNIQSILRTVPALIARRMTGAKKGNPQGKFWDGRLYTRIVGVKASPMQNLMCSKMAEAAIPELYIKRSTRAGPS